MHSRYSLLAYIALTFGIVSSASADVINTYSSESAWAAETVPGFTTIAFPSTALNFNSSNPLTLSGATFTTIGSDIVYEIAQNSSSYWDYIPGGGELETSPPSGPPTIIVTLPTATTSFGLNLTTVGPYNDPLTLTVNGISYSITSFAPSVGFAFFGATFNAPITSFEIQSTAGDYLLADNVSFGTQDDTSGTGGDPSPTPEVATLLMIGAGLISMRMMNRRMHLFN